MLITLESICEAAMTLPFEQRLTLADRLRESSGQSTTVSPALREELNRRWAEHVENPDDVLTWDEAKASALARLKR